MNSSMKSTILSAVGRVFGEKGCAAHVSTESSTAPTTHLPHFLNLYTKTVRDLNEEEHSDLFNAAHKECLEKGELRRLFELLFQTRDAREGKGERDLARNHFFFLLPHYPKVCISLLKLFPIYGYWKDLIQIAMSDRTYQTRDEVVSLFATGLEQGDALCGKWAPREGSLGGSIALLIARKMFPGVQKSAALKNYRKLCSGINEKSKVLETMLCTDRADEINPVHIPSIAMKKEKLAILNEKKGIPLRSEDEETGNRTENPKRIELRKKLLAILAEKKAMIKGARVYPHEIVKEFVESSMSESSKAIAEAQWMSIRDELAKGPGLGNKVALMDVSGSMAGIPLFVAIALGIIVSELTAPAFRNRVITFHENPSWVVFGENDTLEEKIRTAKRAPWGGSTNFAAAMQMILDACIMFKVSPEEIPGLIVFSDMQFDEADEGYATMHEQIKRRFLDAGYPNPPQITYCNLRANTPGHPVQSDEIGTRYVSGWSPTVLKMLVSDDLSVTPMQTLFDALDNPRYDPVRVALSGQIPGYHFTPMASRT
jgi:hypothetical protein